MERGWMNHRAGPPMRYHVCGPRGKFSCTISSRPENGLAAPIRMVATDDIMICPAFLVTLRLDWIHRGDAEVAERKVGLSACQACFSISLFSACSASRG